MIKNQVLVSGATIYELEESNGRSRNRWSAQIQPYVGSDADAEKIAEIIADALNTYQRTGMCASTIEIQRAMMLDAAEAMGRGENSCALAILREANTVLKSALS